MVDLTALEQGEVVVQEGEGVEASLQSGLIFSPFKFLVSAYHSTSTIKKFHTLISDSRITAMKSKISKNYKSKTG